jgi:hypothetical protein
MAKRPLTAIPACTDETPCDAPSSTSSGKALLVQNPTTDCPSALEGDGVPVSYGGEVKNRDGSKSRPIKLPLLQKADGTSFPYLRIMNKAGEEMIIPAPTGPTTRVMFGRNGSWVVGDLPSQACYDPSDVCTDCGADWIAGFREVTDEETGEVSICVVRISPGELPAIASAFWDSTQTVEITGDGTETIPHAANVRISSDDGNLIEVREDGLFVGCCSDELYYDVFGVDPISEL